jgi:hypothetical protein
MPSHDTTRESLSGSQEYWHVKVTLLHTTTGSEFLTPPSSCLFEGLSDAFQHQAHGPLSLGWVPGLSDESCNQILPLRLTYPCPYMGSCYRTVCRRDKSLRFKGQTGVTGTNPTQCHHNGMVLSL